MVTSCNGGMWETRRTNAPLKPTHMGNSQSWHMWHSVCIPAHYIVFIYTWSLPLQAELPKSMDLSTSCPGSSVLPTRIPQTSWSTYTMPCRRPDPGNTGIQDKGPVLRQISGKWGRQSQRSKQLKLERVRETHQEEAFLQHLRHILGPSRTCPSEEAVG